MGYKNVYFKVHTSAKGWCGEIQSCEVRQYEGQRTAWD
jgi:hypothetical protein